MTGAGRADPRVGLVIITHDRRAEALRAVARALALPERPRVVLVDNASADGTAAAVAAAWPAVEVVPLPTNEGAAARNAGAARLGTPYVAFSDDDTAWAPGALARAADLLEAHPRLAVVSARVLVGAEGREDPTCRVMAATPLPRDPALPGHPVLGFLAGASVVRRAAFEAAGGYERRFLIGFEERLLAVDLASAGWAMAYVPELETRHFPSPRRDPVRRQWLLLRNRLWFAWLRRPLAVALGETAALAVRAAADPLARRALLAALPGLPWAWSRRRPAPSAVEAALRLVEAGLPALEAPAPRRAVGG